MLFNALCAVIRPFLMLLSLVFRPVTGNFTAPRRAKQPDKIKLNAAILSDTHVNSSPKCIRKLRNGLSDMERATTPNDVFISVGDTTDRGIAENWEICERIFSEHKPAEKLFIVQGNHDRWRNEDGDGLGVELFLKYSGRLSGVERSAPWFSETVKGYTFIALSQEDDDLLSERQLEWFSDTMEKASHNNLPIFVFMHESLNVSHGLPYVWEARWSGKRLPDIYRSGAGVNSDDIEAIMRKYKNVFYFSGHIHLGLTWMRQMHRFGYSNFESDGSFHKINVPSFMHFNHHGLPCSGLGYQLEVYDREVLIRPRSYAAYLWYSMFDKKFTLE
ncbi:MAG: hypothetical protein GX051_09210 [Clostridiales bacterium]|nr:hypothetical protein [Clostridiales bacterium]